MAVTDEVYEHLVFDGVHVPLATLPGMAERTVTISSGGKTFSFTGWKVGWVSGPAPLVAAVRAAKQFLTYTSGAPFQLAIAAGSGRRAGGDQRLRRPSLRAERDLFCDGLRGLGFTVYRPAATYFATTDIESSAPGMRRRAFCRALPQRCGVVAVPSSVFYDPGDPARGGPSSAGLSASARRSWKRRWTDLPRGGDARTPRPRSGPAKARSATSMRAPCRSPSPGSMRSRTARSQGIRRASACSTSALPVSTMQSLATELGIAETAFVTPSAREGTFDLRWFSPLVEIDLCGHATLASAHALRARRVIDGATPVTFDTRSGALRAAFVGDLIELDFPADTMSEAPLPEALAGEWDAGVVHGAGITSFFAVVVLPAKTAVRQYWPDLAAIAATGHKALLVTAAADPGSGADYVVAGIRAQCGHR